MHFPKPDTLGILTGKSRHTAILTPVFLARRALRLLALTHSRVLECLSSRSNVRSKNLVHAFHRHAPLAHRGSAPFH